MPIHKAATPEEAERIRLEILEAVRSADYWSIIVAGNVSAALSLRLEKRYYNKPEAERDNRVWLFLTEYGRVAIQCLHKRWCSAGEIAEIVYDLHPDYQIREPAPGESQPVIALVDMPPDREQLLAITTFSGWLAHGDTAAEGE